MNNPTHTPGPWRVFNHSWSDTSIVADGFDHGICGLDINHATEESQEADEALMAANARLIAAAPDLVAMLRNLEVSANTVAYCYDKRPENFAAALQQLKDEAEQARELIARATSLPLPSTT